MTTRRSSGGVGGLFKILAWRILLALILVLVTYNPSGFSVLDYLFSQIGTADIFSNGAVKLIVLLVLGILWYIFIKTALKALKMITVAIGVVMLLLGYIAIGAVNDAGVAVSSSAIVYLGEFLMACLMGLGISAGHIKRYWSGTQSTDDVGDDDDND